MAQLDFGSGIQPPRPPARPWNGRARRRVIVGVSVLALAFLLVGLTWYEGRTSTLQAWALSRWAARLSYTVERGPSPHIAFPSAGPFNEGRGYAHLPDILDHLRDEGWLIAAQARQAPGIARVLAWGVQPPYSEPGPTGLVIRDDWGLALYDARPAGATRFASFEAVPPLLVRTLLFMEDRRLVAAADRWRNPAVDWLRLAKAGALFAGRTLGLPVRLEGGSTLAIQLEKYRHSAHGRTASPLDKLRQITGASLRAYRDGPDTSRARRQVVVDYLNTMPLAAAPGVGEVHGVGEGLRVWFGLDLAEVARGLAEGAPEPERVRAFKHILALLYAVRAPSFFLLQDRPALERLVEAQARRLATAGVIDAGLARRLPAARLAFHGAPAEAPRDRSLTADRKAANIIRAELRHLLRVPGLYELDRLHVEVQATLDRELDEATRLLFRRLQEPQFVEEQRLRDPQLLSAGDPREVAYSLLLYERAPEGDLLRARVDSLTTPFDLNGGMKLELGSTAKLRTVAHYLEVVTELHGALSGRDTATLDHLAGQRRDPLTRWAAAELRRAPDLALPDLLERALDRTYSASPHEVFFTGGGLHRFHNFDRREDTLVLPVREALVRSTNLVFIRLMRDLVRYHEPRLAYDGAAVLADTAHPERARLLREVADEEARLFLARAWRKFRGLGPGPTIERLLGRRAASPRARAVLYFAWHPGADPAGLGPWLRTRGTALSDDEVATLARAYGNPRLTIADYGYLLGRHPLDVWAAGELAQHPDFSWDALLTRSDQARRVASAWLFQTRHRRAQDRRLRVRIEEDAFRRMTAYWQRLGFPFDGLVPSYATALGSSADRPAALARLIGIILNDGLRRPRVHVRRLVFAAGTPYRTELERAPAIGERLLPVPVARALRAVLADTVERGTAHRLHGVFRGPDGVPVTVGAKTGSGDNRLKTFARGGRLVASRAVSRTSAVVFSIGDRYYGVMTASVTGPAADRYRFTSALPLAVLRLLAPQINARLHVRPSA